MMRFTYSPLLPGPCSVRLLRLLPDEHEAEIRCEIFNYQLRENQTSCLYEALSYYWGGSDSNVRVHVGTSFLDVTNNLGAALRRLRDPILPRILWIDAISINQEDLVERAQQVTIMDKIYSHASRVMVWLGEESNGSDIACQMILNAAERGQRGLQYNAHQDAHQPEVAMISFLRRPWFYRVWILQEVATSRYASILCGQNEMTVPAFSRGLRLLRPLYDSHPNIVATVESIIYLFEWQSNIGAKSLGISPLASLIDIFHRRQATDRRDKIYALYGMSSDLDSHVNLAVDYERPWPLLFERLIKNILSDNVSVSVSDDNDHADVRGHVCVLGTVEEVDRKPTSSGQQRFQVKATHYRKLFSDNLHGMFWWEAFFTVQRPAMAIQEDDILCLIQGAKSPCIIRPVWNSYQYEIVVIAVQTPPTASIVAWKVDGNETISWASLMQLVTSFERRINLIWDWTSDDTGNESNHEDRDYLGQHDAQVVTTLHSGTAESRIRDLLDAAGLFDDLNVPSGIGQFLQAFETEFTSERLGFPSDNVRKLLRFVHVLRHVYHNWFGYLAVKDKLEYTFSIIYRTTLDFTPDATDYPFNAYYSWYKKLGNIQFDMQDIVSLGIHPRPIKLEGFMKPSKWSIDEGEMGKLLFHLFPIYEQLPEAELLATGLNDTFLQRIVVHCYGHVIQYNEDIVHSALKSGKQGMLLLTLMINHHKPPPQFFEALPRLVVALENRQFGPELATFLLARTSDNARLAYAVLSKAFHGTPEISRPPVIEAIQLSVEKIVYHFENTDLCKIAVANPNDRVIEGLYHLFKVDVFWSQKTKTGFFNYFWNYPDMDTSTIPNHQPDQLYGPGYIPMILRNTRELSQNDRIYAELEVDQRERITDEISRALVRTMQEYMRFRQVDVRRTNASRSE